MVVIRFFFATCEAATAQVCLSHTLGIASRWTEWIVIGAPGIQITEPHLPQVPMKKTHHVCPSPKYFPLLIGKCQPWGFSPTLRSGNMCRWTAIGPGRPCMGTASWALPTIAMQAHMVHPKSLWNWENLSDMGVSIVMEVPQNRWFLMENPMNHGWWLGVALF